MLIKLFRTACALIKIRKNWKIIQNTSVFAILSINIYVYIQAYIYSFTIFKFTFCTLINDTSNMHICMSSRDDVFPQAFEALLCVDYFASNALPSPPIKFVTSIRIKIVELSSDVDVVFCYYQFSIHYRVTLYPSWRMQLDGAAIRVCWFP